ncbi:putative protein DDB [Capsicum annuum]|uniref:putative uncharacterized protein DDB_G0281733 n=1 Tax=Capsicum annuum TaxID=4072 RepID=UPI001FB132BD|nr:putative uncharacterized protein DDB_G0281733 [Capsicum annuum]
MDIFSYTISSSSSDSSSTYIQEVKKNKKILPSYYSSLHGVRKIPTKPMTKQPIAPLPPTPPKIYRVEPINFKEVVQMLTAAPEFQSVSDDSISSSVSGSSSGVQMLTAAPELQSVSNNSVSSSDSAFGSGSGSFNSRRLQNVAPPPLDLSPVSLQRNNRNNNNNNISAVYNDSINEEQERSHVAPRIPSENYFGSCSPLANFPLSPASFAWCSSILFSPGTLTSPSTVL